MNRIALSAVVVASIMLASCTDTTRAKISSYGENGHIECYSGGVKVLDAYSTGRITKEESGGDGYALKDYRTGKLVESNAECVVHHGVEPPSEKSASLGEIWRQGARLNLTEKRAKEHARMYSDRKKV